MIAPLIKIMRDQIRHSGPLTVAEYMDLSLMHPQFGYYVTHDPLGAEGDFTTASEITQVFGEVIGLWCVEVWKSLGSPNPFVLCELGPGRGTLMQDALRAGRLVPGYSEAVRLHLLEASPFLKAKQQEALKDYKPRHIAALTELPDLPVIIIANEFFDALPIRQFVRYQGNWKERRVAITPQDALAYVLLPASDAPDFDLPDESVVEVCPSADHWASAIARPIVKNTGAALIIDYGDDEVVGETLQALSHHRPAHPLSMPGRIDLTAHVSFDPIATAARKIGCRIRGPVPQGEWLLTLGARERTEQLCANATEPQQRNLRTALARLTDPAAMGNIFKVMSFTNRNAPPPPGFD